MKAGLFAASAAILLQVAAAQPHGHRHQHEKKDAVVTVVATVAKEIVYVDEDGAVVSTFTSVAPAPTTTPSPTPSPSPAVKPVVAAEQKPTTVAPPPPPASSAAAPAPAKASPAAPSVPGGKCLNGGNFKGATYNPYAADGGCKDAPTVTKDIQTLAGLGFNMIRTYGPACSGYGAVVAAAKAAKVGVIAGLFDADWESDFSQMKSQLNNDLSYLSAITLWNEAVNNGAASPSAVASALGSLKGSLSGTSFTGDVFAVDTQNVVAEASYQPVIEAADCVGVNAHPFFDTALGGPENAASWVSGQISSLQKVSQGKTVLITETGWPGPGGAGGSAQAQQTAVNGLRDLNVFLFSYFSTAWQGSFPNGMFGWENTGLLSLDAGI